MNRVPTGHWQCLTSKGVVACPQMEVALFKLCLNPVQSARSKALAYPLYPDALAIINAVAEAAGAPVAAQLMLRPPDPVSCAALRLPKRTTIMA